MLANGVLFLSNGAVIEMAVASIHFIINVNVISWRLYRNGVAQWRRIQYIGVVLSMIMCTWQWRQ